MELSQSLPSQVAVISPFVDQLMRFIAKFRAVDGGEVDIEMAPREALAIAVIHGNQEDPRKPISVACRCNTDGEVSIAVQDEDKGLTAASHPIPPLPRIGCSLTDVGST